MAANLEADVSKRLGTLVERVRERGAEGDKTKMTPEERKTSAIEIALRMLTTRVVTARSVGELAHQLDDVSKSLGKDDAPAKIDRLRSVVALKVEEVIGMGDKKGEITGTKNHVDTLLKKGEVNEAVAFLRKLSRNKEYELKDKQKRGEIDELLDSVEELHNDDGSDTDRQEKLTEKVEKGEEKLESTVSKELVKLRNKNDEVEGAVGRKRVEEMIDDDEPKTEGKVELEKAKAKELEEKAEGVVRGDDRRQKQDQRFVRKLFRSGSGNFGTEGAGGEVVLDIEKIKYRDAKYLYARVNTLRGMYQDRLGESGNEELVEHLDRVEVELREHLFQLEEEQRAEKIGKGLADEKLDELAEENLDFMQRNQKAADFLSEAQKERARRGMGRTNVEGELQNLIAANPDLENKLVFKNNEWYWTGQNPEEFFELCRREIYKIKETVPEERLGNLIFERSAQTYLALMSVSSKEMPQIKQMKEAVTKTLYMEFALKSMWKGGGVHESWQRAAGLILRESADTNFFLTMRVREKLRGVDHNGEHVEIPGFNVDDMMTLGELEAPNGQSWLAYISTNNIHQNEIRLQEMGQALAHETLNKARLKGKITEGEYREKLAVLQNGVEFDEDQMDWVRNYMHYMHAATLNAGEKLWLMDGREPGTEGWEYASLPAGQITEKMGMWALLYFAKYGVTKYGFEGLGKLFLPNPGLLSYARGETMGHFLSNDGDDAWLKMEEGGVANAGGGAKNFFFGGREVGKETLEKFNKFWEEVWLDERMGNSLKSKGMRSLKNSRAKGVDLMENGQHQGFIEQMEFGKLEDLVGYEIPGGSKEAKLRWMVENLDYEMLRKDLMPSKREADWLSKYTKYYAEATTLLQGFLDAPTLANKMKIIDMVARYNNSALDNLATQLDDFVADNRKINFGAPKKGEGSKLNPLNYFGPKVPEKQSELQQSEDGDWMRMPMKRVSPTDGWYPGRRLFKLTRQDYKEGTNDPMVMRKIEIENMIAWGLVSPKKGGEMMRAWQKDIYFGEKIKIGGVEMRAGMIPFLTPIFLYRGWWVDRMGLDWQDFLLVTRKTNEDTWEKLKKVIGLS